MSASLVESALPFSASNGMAGVLVLHGITATVATVRPLAEAFADAGFSVEAPLLPGHGTAPEDLEPTGFPDWLDAAAGALDSLAARSDQVVVVGHSMGGTLALALAVERRELAGLVLVNPFVDPPADPALELLRRSLRNGQHQLPWQGAQALKDGVAPTGYDTVATAALLSLFEATAELAPRLGEITCPTLLMTGRHDRVVTPNHGDLVAASLSGPVERVVLERSAHLAPLDNDAHELELRAVAFAQKCCA